MSELNVNKGYTPGNCRWANAKQQRQNQRPVKRRRRAELGAIHQYARSLAAAGSSGNAVLTAMCGNSTAQET
jgi:hypothetical protein